MMNGPTLLRTFGAHRALIITALAAGLLLACTDRRSAAAASGTDPDRAGTATETPPTADPKPRTDAPDANPYYVNHKNTPPIVDGFAILARDPATGDLGAAIVSRSPAVGPLAIGARAGVGCVVAMGNVAGQRVARALRALERDRTNEPDTSTGSILDHMIAEDDKLRRHCLLGILDSEGDAAAHPSSQTNCGALTSDNLVIVAFSVTAAAQTPRLVERWAESAALPLDERLFTALQAAVEIANEDARSWPARSAALLVTRQNAGPFGRSDRLIDIRVDYHGAPTQRLGEVLEVARQAFVAPRLLQMQKLLPIDDPIRKSNSQWIRRIRRRIPLGATD